MWIQDTSVYVFQMMNSFGDNLDLKHVLNPNAEVTLHQDPSAIEDIDEEGHCSVMIKVRSFDVEMDLSSFHYEIALCLFSKG